MSPVTTTAARSAPRPARARAGAPTSPRAKLGPAGRASGAPSGRAPAPAPALRVALAPAPRVDRLAPPVPFGPAVAARPAPRRQLTPWTPFVMVVCALLSSGLLALLLLNTVMAQDAFVLFGLQSQQARLAEQEATLRRELDLRGSPASLAKAADKLGLVQQGPPRFLDAAAPAPFLGAAAATTPPGGERALAGRP